MENPISCNILTQDFALLLHDPVVKTIKYPTPANHCKGGITGVRWRFLFPAVFYNIVCTLAALFKC